jgi:hypothetical protein
MARLVQPSGVSLESALKGRLMRASCGIGLMALSMGCAEYDHAPPVGEAGPVPWNSASVAAGGSGSGGTADMATGLARASSGSAGGRFYAGGGPTSSGNGSGGQSPAGGPVDGNQGGAASAGSSGDPQGGGVGAGGTPPAVATDRLLSRDKPTATDSEQSSRFHFARSGNDGDATTRWCAADYRLNHYWEVDLEDTYTLSALHIIWEKETAYRFKVESSVDHTNWSTLLDRTQASDRAAEQSHQLPIGAFGRYVRLTVTGGLTTTEWASFYEFDVFGY